MKKTYPIKEYEAFTRGKEVLGSNYLPAHTFDALENFILSSSVGSAEAIELMGISARKGVGKIITARNYVGVITMDDGTTIEILPKVYPQEAISEDMVKMLLIDMLRTLSNIPFKFLQAANVNVAKMNIFEIFIRMFVDEVFYIVKRGLKCDYETIQSNESVFKGKMMFTGQIKHNYVHKERCFAQYDEFNPNRAENKIIKSTLCFLYKNTTSIKNKTDIKTLLNAFYEVDESKDYKADFSKIVPDRKTTDYQTALQWCKVFLMGKSFTSFSGSDVAFALLFPMETLFENYIAAKMRKILCHSEYMLSAQDRAHHLFDEPEKFLLRPDIVIRNEDLSQVFIIDTKWKVLSDTKINYGISQADMYQMYAYQKKYEAKNVTLLYPFTDKVDINKDIRFLSHDGNSETEIKVRFVDLFDIKKSLENIVSEITLNRNNCFI